MFVFAGIAPKPSMSRAEPTGRVGEFEISPKFGSWSASCVYDDPTCCAVNRT